ncbi:MAG: ribulose-phosphate 3-epimerase [Proteobacteria bacterium]|nr:ribulose-phosphate 3-epimerase [Pseudomonadota bacterium]
MKISPSILSADFGRLAEEVRAVEEAGADYIHIDVMDGHFVPNITIGPFVVAAVKKVTNLPLDVHLMIENPERYVPEFAKAGSDIITVHAETTHHLHALISQIKALGKKAGVSLNPATPVHSLGQIIGDLDLVLVMSVNPGFSGQSFIPSSLNKIKKVRSIIEKRGSKAELEVDGGVKIDNIAEVASAGADVVVAGSAIYGSDDYKATITAMRKELE